MAKTVLQGTVKGTRRRRQKRGVKTASRTGLEFGESARADGDRIGLRSIVETSSVVPQRLSRLRDRRLKMERMCAMLFVKC